MASDFRIDKLTLKNFRCFSDFSIEFEPDVTVLVARNGGGKTAILDAIAIALGEFTGRFDNGDSIGVDQSDARAVPVLDDAIPRMEDRYPVSVVGEYSNAISEALSYIKPGVFAYQFGRERLSKKSRSRTIRGYEHTESLSLPISSQAEAYQTRIRDGQAVELPLVCYYGTGRLWRKTRKVDTAAKSLSSRTWGYHECLQSDSNYLEFEEWLQKMEHIRFQEPDSDAGHAAEERMLAVRRAVNECLKITGWQEIRYRAATDSITINHPRHGALDVSALSDGVRNVIGMVADIARRMIQLNPNLGTSVTVETSGVVLIDEVDLHLHPEWQQTVLDSLQRAFPKIQFIVTTHSPQVLSTVKARNIRILEERDGKIEAGQPLENPYGRESRVALESIMEVPGRPPVEAAKLLEKYHQAIGQGDIDSAGTLKMRADLEAEFGNESEELQLADLVIRRWQATRRTNGVRP
ncbi:MAG TPA: AAA family ATPase [Candidatus Limnocylindria bacterium]|jgi:predicted ATP-binding protein involved in virulence|nr:AAA family ATPase [Candidatus Limnocylindria bacterium]